MPRRSRADERCRYRPHRAKIEGAINSRKILSEDHGRRRGLFQISVDVSTANQGQHVQEPRQRAGLDTVSIKISKELGARGFKFVGPTIVYAFMQPPAWSTTIW